MSLPNTIYAASELAVHKTTYDTEKFDVGQKLEYADSRKYRFALAGELLVKGELLEGEQITTEDDLTPTATAVGATAITATTTGTEAADYYKGGYAVVATTPGLADLYKLGTHLLLTSGAGDVFNLADETILVALTTASRVSILRNPWKGLISLATTALGWCAGVAVSLIPSAEWGWVQTGGPAACLAGGADIEGVAFAASDNSAGLGITADADSEFVIGQVMLGGDGDGKANIVFLTID
ncbi:hypothetical protein LCGC14_2107270 [marine sediment metagenome]|uniref:Uncharacterized protein n=1 Tax=marine sediment metagenome TaxID=412755 RepID=A0A0F9E826_9ZZZZ